MTTPHIEQHFTAGDTVRDIVIGMSDGLTVPFALAAGLSGAVAATVNATHIIVIGGMAEIAAGSIAMGLGGYLAAKSDAEHYAQERLREEEEIITRPKDEEAEVREVLEAYGMTAEEAMPVVNSIKTRPKDWVDFMMRFELGMEEPDPGRALRSALTIAGSYIAGGFIPLAPYIVLGNASTGLLWSVVVTLLALFGFGFLKGRFTGAGPLKSAVQTMIIGGLAAGAAFGLARWIS